MKRKYHRLWIVAMAVGLALAFMAPVQAAETYQLGLSLAITGPTSDAGNPYSKGAEDYIRFVNETNVLGDAKVDCPIRDDMYETAVTKRNFEDFLDQEMVLFLSYATGANQALAQDFNEVKIPVIPASMDKSLVGMSDYIFLPIASYSHQYVGVAEYVAKNHKGGGVPKVAAFIHPSAFGRAPLEDFKAAVSNHTSPPEQTNTGNGNNIGSVITDLSSLVASINDSSRDASKANQIASKARDLATENQDVVKVSWIPWLLSIKPLKSLVVSLNQLIVLRFRQTFWR